MRLSRHPPAWKIRRAPGGANVNVLNPGHKSDMGENTCVHGVDVMVTPGWRRC
jgi:hypothetical protein